MVNDKKFFLINEKVTLIHNYYLNKYHFPEFLYSVDDIQLRVNLRFRQRTIRIEFVRLKKNITNEK